MIIKANVFSNNFIQSHVINNKHKCLDKILVLCQNRPKAIIQMQKARHTSGVTGCITQKMVHDHLFMHRNSNILRYYYFEA